MARSAGGGFSVEAERGGALRATADHDGWQIEGLENPRLRRIQTGGMVLETCGGERELARTMPLVGLGAACRARHLLLENGQLFRIAPQGLREPRYVLTGWETSGAYYVAYPEPAGWRIEPQPASCGLADPDVPLLMMAAEILEADPS